MIGDTEAGLSGQGVAMTTRPLMAVSSATMVMAALVETRSAPTPAISAPIAKPASRQKR